MPTSDKKGDKGDVFEIHCVSECVLYYELTEQKRNLATAVSVDVLFFLMANLLVIA